MTVTVRLFGALRERAPARDATEMVGILELDERSVVNVDGVLGVVGVSEEDTGHLILNGEYVKGSTPVSDGDTLSVFPKNMAIKWLM